MKYKVGDKVKIHGVTDHRRAYNGRVVTIKGINPNGETQNKNGIPHYGVGEVYIFYENELSLANAPKIVITTDGMETLARLYEGNNVIKTATARCAPDDTFDFATGAKLAFERLMAEEKFTPHLVCDNKNYGIIGEPTNYKDAIGRPLCVGDVVEHFDGNCESYGDTVIVNAKLPWQNNKEKVFVMGIEGECNDKNGTTGDWNIIKKRSFEEVANGEEVYDIKYVKEI